MKKLLPLIVVIIVSLLFNVVEIRPQNKSQENTQDIIQQIGEIHSIDNAKNVEKLKSETLKCINYREKDFMNSVNLTNNKDVGNAPILGGIIPHHLLADKIIASFFQTVTSNNPDIEVVILIAPNHNRIGASQIHTGLWDWETPFGILQTETSIVTQLTSEYDAGTSFKLLQEEHSISSLIPYVKYFLPSSEIVPILLHGNFGLYNSIALGEKLINLVYGKSYIIIASIDFSHYLPVETADKMDQITLEAIKSQDLTALSRMSNDHLDSPPSIIALLSAMEKAEAKSMKILDHSNSARIAGEKSDSTTSYFSIVFSKKHDK